MVNISWNFSFHTPHKHNYTSKCNVYVRTVSVHYIGRQSSAQPDHHATNQRRLTTNVKLSHSWMKITPAPRRLGDIIRISVQIRRRWLMIARPRPVKLCWCLGSVWQWSAHNFSVSLRVTRYIEAVVIYHVKHQKTAHFPHKMYLPASYNS